MKHFYFIFLVGTWIMGYPNFAYSQATTYDSNWKSVDAYTYFVKLSAEESKKFLDSPYSFQLDSNKDFTPISSIEDIKQHGNYLIAKINGSKISYSFYANHNLYYKVASNFNKGDIQFYEKTDTLNSIELSRLSLDKKSIRFNSESRSYSIKREGLYGAIYKNDTVFFEINKDEAYNWNHRFSIIKRLYYFSYRKLAPLILKSSKRKFNNLNYENYNGYFILNKPKFNHNDTLKYQAILLNNRRNKVTKNAILKISSYKQELIADTLFKSAIKNGVYYGEFIIPDSLKLDRNYQLQLLSKNNKKLYKETSFKIENYTLNDNTYAVKTKHESLYLNDTLKFSISSFRSNNLPILGANCEIIITTNSIESFLDSTVFIPDTLYNSTIHLEATGTTLVSIPLDKFPKALVRCLVELKFTDQNLEIHEESFRFNSKGHSKKITYDLQNGSLNFTFQNANKEYDLYGYFSKNDSLLLGSYSSSGTLNINPKFRELKFLTYGYSETINLSKYKPDIFCNCVSNKEVEFTFYNPWGLKINYWINKTTNKSTEIGSNQKETFTIKSNLGKALINYSYMWNGVLYEEYQVCKYQKNKIEIDLEGPLKVYPGQETSYTIKLTSSDKKPIPNADVLAFAINKDFNHSFRFPKIYSSWEYTPEFEFSTDDNENSILNFESLKSAQITSLRLDTTPFYEFINPKEKIIELSETTLTQEPQVSIFGMANSLFILPKAIVINNELVFLKDVKIQAPYSFIVPSQTIEIKYYLADTLYTLNVNQLSAFTKTYISFNLFDLPKSVTKSTLTLSQKDSLKAELKRHTMYIAPNYTRNKTFIKSKNQIFDLGRIYSGVYSIGPISLDSITYLVQNEFTIKFPFEPGYSYTVQNNLIKQREYNGSANNGYYSSSNNYLSNYALTKLPKHSNRRSKFLNSIFSKMPVTTYTGNGTLTIKKLNFQNTLITQLNRCDSPHNSSYYEGHVTNFNNLNPGEYSVSYWISSDSIIKYDSLLVRANGVNYYNLDNNKPLILASAIVPQCSIETVATYNGNSSLRGTIKDDETDEPLPFVNLILSKNGVSVAGVNSDFDGKFKIENIKPGTYTLTTNFIGFKPYIIKNIILNNGKITFINIGLKSSNIEISEFEVVAYSVPLISKDNTTISSHTITSEEISKLPNRSVPSLAQTVGGVYSEDNPSINLNVRGSRSDANYVFIDGIKVRTSSSFPQSAEFIPQSSGKIRSNFNDEAFWKPALVTNKNGEVSFKTTFPDNVAGYQSYFLALGRKGKSGSLATEIVSQQAVSSELKTPDFLLEGDSVQLQVNNINYTQNELVFKTALKENNLLIDSKNGQLKSIEAIKFNYIAPKKIDSIKLSAETNFSNNILDGEEKLIAITPVGFQKTLGENFIINGSKTLLFEPKENSNEQLIISANKWQNMRYELIKLADYPYSCTEQTASKIIALQLVENNKSAIKKLQKLLTDRVNFDGGIGWWNNSKSGIFTSAYSYHVAKKYLNKEDAIPITEPIEQYFVQEFNQFSPSQKINSLVHIVRVNQSLAKTLLINGLDSTQLSDFEQILFGWTQNQLYRKPFNYLSNIIESFQTSNYNGELYYKANSNSFNQSSFIATLYIYDLIKADAAQTKLDSIETYFFNYINSGVATTYEKAMFVDYELQNNHLFEEKYNQSAKVQINGIEQKQLPKIIELNQKINLEINDAKHAIVQKVERIFIESPTVLDSSFSIISSYSNTNKTVDTLKNNELYTYNIEISSISEAEHVVVTVPIPAGTTFYAKPQFGEHTEYQNNRVEIFFTKLPKGKTNIKIPLQTKFTGSFNVNPIQVELMYQPLIQGNTAKSRIVIQQHN